jgi:two-component system, chemotaxis family, CheB/CheR fusion protein
MSDTIPSPRLRVLVVDDCDDHTESLALLLGLWGYEALVAADGRAALDVAGARHPDVVLLDVGLPGMDGYELARQLRRLPGLGEALLLTLSGYAQEADRQRALAAGCADHLVKPVDLDLLRGLLADWKRPAGGA